jgi:cephalosporin hydroxylase
MHCRLGSCADVSSDLNAFQMAFAFHMAVPAYALFTLLAHFAVQAIAAAQSNKTLDKKCSIASLMGHMRKMVATNFEGGTDAAEFVVEQALIQKVEARTVCETGFNFGGSSLAWLCASPQVKVYSFDVGKHKYVPIARDYLKKVFGKHRLTLTIGDSAVTLPKMIQATNASCDVAFVDGGHTFEVAFADIKSFKALTAPHGRMLLENCNVNGKSIGWGGMKPVNDAYQEALRQGIVEHEEQISTAGCRTSDLTTCREICVAHYL